MEKRTRKIWTMEEDKFLKENYPHLPTVAIAEAIGCSIGCVYNRAFFLKLKKTQEYHDATQQKLARKLQENGKSYRYPKGHIPANKGKKMPKHVYEKAKATMFPKGHIPANHKSVGYERVTKDGYIEVKVAEGKRFRLKHRLIWEQANGPIPPGYNVQFRDGNKQNFALENLYLISRSDQLKNENSLHARYPEEIRKSIQLMGALQRQINKRKDNHE